jgi:thioredoxin-like negative regulator of GroEL
MKRIITLAILSLIASTGFAQMKDLSQSGFLEKVVNIFESPNPVYRGDKPCVVLFYSERCPYSKQMEKHIVKAAKNFKNQILLYKIDIFKIDEYVGESLMKNIDFQGTPTVAMFLPEDNFDDIYLYFTGMATVEDLEEVFDDFVNFW